MRANWLHANLEWRFLYVKRSLMHLPNYLSLNLKKHVMHNVASF